MGNESHTQEKGAGTAWNSRRQVLKAVGASSAVALAGCTGGENGTGDEAPMGNYPIEGDTAVYGYHGPLSGALAPDGVEQERGFELAIDHLNNGGGWVDELDALSGDGVLGYEIDYVTGDSAGDEETSIDNIERMIDRDGIQFWTGGVSSGVCQALQPIAQREHVPFFSSISQDNEITGENCHRYHFRPSIGAELTARGLAEVLPDLLGEDREYYQIYLDYSYGISNRDSMQSYMEDYGWEEQGATAMPFGELDHSTAVADLDDSGADVLIYTTFGEAMANGLNQLDDAGLLDDLDIIIPLISAFSMEPAGGNAEGVIGATNWHANASDELDGQAAELSDIFVEEYQAEYGEMPGQAAMEVYDNVMVYSSAVESAETFHPQTVVEELEGFSWEHGIGAMEFRECDHQAQRPVYVCEGLSEEEQEETGLYLDLLEIVPGEDAIYDCDQFPASECDMPGYQ